MPEITFPAEAWANLILTAERDRIYLEGNILKVLDPGESPSYQAYLDKAITTDKEKREQRLAVTKQVQDQNNELLKAKGEIEQSQHELEDALERAEQARKEAEGAWQTAQNDLDYMQKRTQFELMGNIVRVALLVIAGVGFTTTAMYATALFILPPAGGDTTLLGNTWSNMFGILLTNSFSIIGTIMGVKYATEGRGGSENG
jgi:hypothetical protein